jgi:hypothetical protein
MENKLSELSKLLEKGVQAKKQRLQNSEDALTEMFRIVAEGKKEKTPKEKLKEVSTQLDDIVERAVELEEKYSRIEQFEKKTNSDLSNIKDQQEKKFLNLYNGLKQEIEGLRKAVQETTNQISFGGGGGGAATLRDLYDIDFSTLSPDYVLSYDGMSGAFVFREVTATGGTSGNQIRKYETDLSGTNVTIPVESHSFQTSVVEATFVRSNRKVDVYWFYDPVTKNFIIESNVDLTGVKLTINGY